MVDVEVEKKALTESWKDLVTKLSNKDADGVAEYLIEDSVAFLPESKLDGREPWRNHLIAAFKALPKINISITNYMIEMSSSGDLAYGVSGHQITEKETGNIHSTWQEVHIWKKIDGAWKMIILSENPISPT